MAGKIDFDRPIRFDWNELSAADYEDFEAETGLDLQEFAEAMENGDINERNLLKNLRPFIGFLWIIWRREDPTLTYDDVRHEPLVKLVESVEIVPVEQEQQAPAQQQPQQHQSQPDMLPQELPRASNPAPYRQNPAQRPRYVIRN